MSEYEPLKITAWLRCGIATDGTLPIDSILFDVAMRERYGPPVVLFPGVYPDDIEAADVPLARRGDGERWYYAASFAQWEGVTAEYTNHWVKRLDQQQSGLIDFRGRRGKVIIEQGAYKAYRMPMFPRHALSVCWYVVGDRAWIAHALRFMTHIGKKPAQGEGRTLQWEVEPWADDWSVWGPDGRLMRAIPDDGGILTGMRPSYWLPRNQMRCRMPEGV